MVRSSRLSKSMRSLSMPKIVSKVGSPFGADTVGSGEEFFDSGYEILVVKGAESGTTFPLNAREITLGRLESSGDEKAGQVLFKDRSVSPTHAMLKWDEEFERYVIYHLSSSSPTVVNGRIVKKSLLNNDYKVQLGGLIFKVVSVKEKQLRDSAVMWDKMRAAEDEEEQKEVVKEEKIDTGYKLVVVDGPDKGRSFTLERNLLVIGKHRGRSEIREKYGILLSDESLPEELALLVWDFEEKKYRLFQSESSEENLRLYRVLDTDADAKEIAAGHDNLLEDKDSMTAGQTVMAIHKATKIETHDAKVDIEKELKVRAQTIEPDSGMETMAGQFRIDYVFEVLEGTDRGNKISILSEEVSEGRVITFGTRGDGRQNDVELDDIDLVNNQGYFEFYDGSLYLINEAGGAEVLVNTYEIGENEKIILNGGDRIKLGNTVLVFTDNRVIAALKNYSLQLLSWSDGEGPGNFPLNKTMMFIGRGSACDVRIHDGEVSRLHAVLSFKGNRFHLEHKSKVNPTFVNGVSLKRNQDRIIFPGDKIYISSKNVLQLNRVVE